MINCPHFKRCGGCSWLDVPYEEQLVRKTEKLKMNLQPFRDCEISEITPSESPYYYRNKMEFTFGGTVEEPFLGQHFRGSFHRIENLTRCLLFDERAGVVLEAVRNFARIFKIQPYNPKTHEGFLRHLKIRVSKTRDEMMIILVTAGKFEKTAEFVSIFESFPFVKSVYYGINSRLSDIADCEELHLLSGEEHLYETLGDTTFIISPESFFQPNTATSKKMYDSVREMLNLKGDECVLDLYSGSGGIGIYIAKDIKFLYSIEIQKESAEILRQNLKKNGLENVEVFCGDVKNVIPVIKRNKFDVAVIDPPRSGMSKKAIRKVIGKNAERIVFFSCKIETAVPNLLEFAKYGFRIKKAVPFDMFPHTPFMESIFLLER